jgi:tripeptide aminopeptidase
MSPPRSPAAEPTSTIQQEIAAIVARANVKSAVDWFRANEAQLSRWQVQLASIPAPPFGEANRADWLTEQFRTLGLKDVVKDGVGNAIGLLPGTGPAVSLSAHLDTVFPAGTPLDIREQGRRFSGPGISDNAAGVVALLAIAAVFQQTDLPHRAPLLFIGNVGEEGEGDLRGMRHVFTASEWKERIAASVIIDGAGTDTIIAEALGSRRFEVTVRGPGGHSWSDFGTPNPIVALGQAVHIFSETRVSTFPKTTFNVGVISGGTSVNSIPESATMRVDIRSTSAFEIERLEMELRRAVELAIAEEQRRAPESRPSRNHNLTLSAEIKAIGNRPAGELPANARILQIAKAVDAHLGNNAQIQRASTDANIPISLGREAIALGAGGRGGGAHTLQEWFDSNRRELGLQRILLILLALAGEAE